MEEEKTMNRSLIHRLNRIGNTFGGLIAISGILLSIFLYLIPDISLPSWLKLLLVIVMLWSFHKLFVILRDFILSRSKPSIPHGQIFRGIFIHNGGTPADTQMLFDRSQEIEELEKNILHEDAKDHILAVTGVSWVGKSILIEMLVDKLDKLKKEDTNLHKITLARFNNPEKSDLSIINDSISFVRQHKDILCQSRTNNRNPYVIIILDQFEVCLDHIVDVYLNSQFIGDVASEMALWQLVEMPREARLDEGAQRGKRVLGSNVP